MSRSVTDAPGGSRTVALRHALRYAGPRGRGMAPSDPLSAGDGRAHPRTTPGPPYQLRPSTGPATLGSATHGDAPRYAGVVHDPILRRARVFSVAVAALVAVVALGACGSGSLYTSFDPTAPCAADGRFPGAYPALEARLPTAFQGKQPDTVDSGRNCSTTELGTLAGHGLHEVRYAGASWFLSGNAGITLAVFQGDGLTAEWLGEWYEAAARAASNTRQIDPTRPMVAGRQGYRLDTINGDSLQSVIDWPSPGGDLVFVVVAADAPAATIDAALAAFPAGP